MPEPDINFLYILNDAGVIVPCPDVIAWAEWMSTHERLVASTTIFWENFKEDSVRVATHFIGFDYGFGQTDKPILYETMVFGGNLNHHTERTDDEYLAMRRHYLVVGTVVTIEKGYQRRAARQLENNLARLKSIDDQTGSSFAGMACPKCGGTLAHRMDCEDEIQFA